MGSSLGLNAALVLHSGQDRCTGMNASRGFGTIKISTLIYYKPTHISLS